MRAAAAIVMVRSAAGAAGARRHPLVARGFHPTAWTPKGAPEAGGLPADLPARS